MIHRLVLSAFFTLAVVSLGPRREASGRPRRPPFVPLYSVTEVGPRPGGEPVQALGIDAEGHVSGWWRGNFARGIFWGAPPHTLELEVPSGWAGLVFTGVNSSGVATGFLGLESSNGPDLEHPFVWKDGVLTDLGTVGGYEARPSAINEAGQVVGNSDHIHNVSYRGFLWDGTQRFALDPLGRRPNTYGDSYAFDINNGGQIVGATSTETSNLPHPVTWINRHAAALGDPKNAWYAYGVAINDHGTIAVWGRGNAPDRGVPFLWRDGVYTQLPGLTPTASAGINDLNENDVAVGSSASRAVIWKDGQITDLNTQVPQDLGATLHTTIAINNRGQLLCLSASDEDYDRAFVLTPRPTQEFSGGWMALKAKRAGRKWKLTGSLRVENAGIQALAASQVRFLLSPDLTSSAGDVTLKDVQVKALPAAGFAQLKLSASAALAQAPSGSYVLAVLDAGGAVTEADETNNVVAFGPLP
jgi:probable HAF family extracellular repeat protein